MRLLACLIVAPQRGYDEPAILSYAISSFCPTSADGLQFRGPDPGGRALVGPIQPRTRPFAAQSDPHDQDPDVADFTDRFPSALVLISLPHATSVRSADDIGSADNDRACERLEKTAASRSQASSRED